MIPDMMIDCKQLNVNNVREKWNQTAEKYQQATKRKNQIFDPHNN